MEAKISIPPESSYNLFISNEPISSAKFSPYSDNKILFSTSKNYGIIGTGYLYLIQVLIFSPKILTRSCLMENLTLFLKFHYLLQSMIAVLANYLKILYFYYQIL